MADPGKIRSTAFSRAQLPQLLQFVAENAQRRWPAVSLMMTSDVAWQLPGSDPKNNIRLFYDGALLIGYLWYDPPAGFTFDIDTRRPDRLSIGTQMLDWVQEKRGDHPPGTLTYLKHRSMTEWADAIRNPPSNESQSNRTLTLPVLESDVQGSALVEQAGYTPSEHSQPFYVHDLSVPDTARGALKVRAVRDDELEQFVDTHRAAWAPSTGFSLERCLAVRSIDSVFDSELGLVAIDQQGKFAACCIFWTDPVSRVGSIEPFGTRPEYRGQGVSQALIYEGLRQLKIRGMIACRIYTAGFNHPAQRLYQACGFREVDSARTWVKIID